MKNILVVVAILALISVLTACGGHETIRYVDRTVTKVVTFPDHLLEPCKAAQPPLKTTYVDATDKEREQQLTDYSILLLKNVKDCDGKITQVRELQEKQKKIYTSTGTTQ